LATVCAAKLSESGVAEALQTYRQLLAEQISNWPDATSTDKTRIWLGKISEFDRNWAAAIGAYQGVSAQDPDQLNLAVQAADRCWQHRLEQLTHQKKPVATEASNAAAYFERVVLGPEKRMPERFGKLAQFAALAAARIRLNFTSDGYAQAESLLRAAINGSPTAEPKWREEAQALLVVALAGQNRVPEAVHALQQVSGNSPQVLLQTVSRLSDLAAKSTPQARQQLASVQQAAIQLLRPQVASLDADGRMQLDRVEAEAFLAIGKLSQAVTIYARLVQAHPKDGVLSERYGELLLVAKDPQALAQWRQILRKSRPDTARWYRAKYNVALAHYRMGNKAEAAKMIRFLKALKPDLGGPSLKPKFEELLRLCS
jgi:tetratricopeptide (TPR) repeat protein